MKPSMPRRLDRRTIYENPWVDLYVDRVEFPDGRIIEEHHVIGFQREAVAALVEREDQALLMVEAYRYTTNSIGWEIPAGGIEVGEEVLLAAEREVFEESGYRTSEHQLIYTFHPMNGISNQIFHLAHCRAEEQAGGFDRNEVRSIAWFTPKELNAMIDSRELVDGYTLTGVLWHLRQISEFGGNYGGA